MIKPREIMRVKYSQAYVSKKIGIGFIICFAAILIYLIEPRMVGLAQTLGYPAVFYTLLGLAQWKWGYITIKETQIKKVNSFHKAIDLKQIEVLNRQGTDIILKTADQSLSIDTSIIKENALKQLNMVLKPFENTLNSTRTESVL